MSPVPIAIKQAERKEEPVLLGAAFFAKIIPSASVVIPANKLPLAMFSSELIRFREPNKKGSLGL